MKHVSASFWCVLYDCYPIAIVVISQIQSHYVSTMNPSVGPSQESPRAPEKRPAVPRFRHPPPAPRSEEAGMEPAKVWGKRLKSWKSLGNPWEIFGKNVFKILVFPSKHSVQTKRAWSWIEHVVIYLESLQIREIEPKHFEPAATRI